MPAVDNTSVVSSPSAPAPTEAEAAALADSAGETYDPTNLTPGQKAAHTRAANKAAEEEAEQKAAAAKQKKADEEAFQADINVAPGREANPNVGGESFDYVPEAEARREGNGGQSFDYA